MAVPTDIAGLLLDIDASTLTGAHGDPIPSLPDGSGNARHATQGTAGARPTVALGQTLGGLPVARFDGGNDFLATPAFASPTAGVTAMVLVRLSLVDNAYRSVYNHAGAATWVAPYSKALLRVMDNVGVNAWQGIIDDATVPADSVVSTPTAAVASVWQIVELVYDGANIVVRRNGTQIATGAKTGAMSSVTQPVYIGADTSGAENLAGDLAEVMSWNRGLTGPELAQMRAYLTAKWLTAPVVPPSTRPATIPFTEAVYARLEPVATQDEALGWPMLIFCQALGEMARQVEELLRPTDPDRRTGDPILDVDLTPDWNLPYVGQFVGVRVQPDATPAQARAQIRDVGGFKRGTVAAMKAAVKATLTGTQFVDVIERDGDAWHITVTTRAGDTPNPAATLAAALAQKAAGLILTVVNTATIIYTEAEFRWGALPAVNVEAMFTTGNDAEAVV